MTRGIMFLPGSWSPFSVTLLAEVMRYANSDSWRGALDLVLGFIVRTIDEIFEFFDTLGG